MTDTRTLDMLPIEHLPFQPPRKGHEGEEAFLQLWREFAERAPDDFAMVFHDLSPDWNQRAASVAASFVMWLGTNFGANLLAKAERIAATMAYREAAYLSAWAIENRRRQHINHGLRAIEHMLAEKPLLGDGRWTQHTVQWEHVPTVTVLDLDVVDCIMVWLSSPQGRQFAEAGTARIAAARKARETFEPTVIGGSNRTTSGAIGMP